MSFNWHFGLILSILLTAIFLNVNVNTVSSSRVCIKYQCKVPTTTDSRLKVQIVYQKNDTSASREPNQLSPVTSMAFLGDKDIVILDKNDGKVLRIVNYTLLPKPLLDVSVANKWERGLLGVAVSKEYDKAYVFLYYTESKSGDGEDICPSIFCAPSSADPSKNNLYRYELKNNSLVNPKLLFSLPPSYVASHIGGSLQIGPDGNLYIIVGDFHGNYNKTTSTTALNFKNGEFPDGRAGILRFTQEGKVVGHGILGERYPLNLYYAYGIRNGFGLDFDPVSGKLWDTENGPNFGDEVNLVEPGFNSGWAKIQGIWQAHNHSETGKVLHPEPEDLVSFGGSGKYNPPKLVWNNTVAPTAIKFLNSNKLGEEYKNDLFVASFNFGKVYHFDLNDNRTRLIIPTSYNDSLVPEEEEPEEIVFARGLGKITDMDEGPDGDLYILSRYFDKPTIFRISSVNETN